MPLAQMHKRKLFKIVAGTIAVLAVVWTAVYVFVSISEPFERLKEFAHESKAVNSAAGSISSIRPNPFSPFSASYSDVSGTARLSAIVAGAKKKVELRVEMTKANGKWYVDQATLDGERVAPVN